MGGLINEMSNVENVSLDLNAVHPITKEKVVDVFCKDWFPAKDGLVLLLQIVKNPFVKVIIKCIISLGDGLQVKFYKK